MTESIAPEPSTDQRTPITQILAMTDVKAREAALQKTHDHEREQFNKNPHAFSKSDVPYLTNTRLVALVAKKVIKEDDYIQEMHQRQQSHPNAEKKSNDEEIKQNLNQKLEEYEKHDAINRALDKKQRGKPLSELERAELATYESQLEYLEGKNPSVINTLRAPRALESERIISNQPDSLDIHTVTSETLWQLVKNKEIPYHEYQAEVKRRDSLLSPSQFTESPATQASRNPDTMPNATGIRIEYRNLTPINARGWIATKVPTFLRGKLNDQLDEFESEGGPYSVSIGKDAKGVYQLVKFQLPNPWTYVKKNAEQSVTRSVSHELGKGGNRLINPDYAHNEMMNQFKLVRDALPPGTATRQMLEKTDKVVTTLLTASGLTAEAVNLLVNALRGALLEAPELKYKVAALVPDDVVRQSYVAAVRTGGNTLRAFIHKKYNIPDRPKVTPVMVNTLDQIKPEHYRAQDAQKVGITRRDLNREDAIKFIHEFVPIEKQESAIETIGRLSGNQFGVSIMDSGWVRIDSSAREPRTYDNRPRYGSYNATDATKMP